MKQNPNDTRVVVLSVLLAALVGCGEPGAQTVIMTTAVADHLITEQIAHKLDNELFRGEGMVRVDTRAGTVRLSGYVACEDDRNRAKELVGSVSGVKLIQNDISVLQLDPGCPPSSRPWPQETRRDRFPSI